jgi:glycosyltransferase involved in cell wall biosynthesis
MQSGKLKGILMLVNDFPPIQSGGAERQAERLATFMGTQHIFVGVLTRREALLPRREERNGFAVYRLTQFGPGKMKTLTFTLAAVFSLIRLRNCYDILHAHLAFSPAIAGTIAGRILGKQVIVKFGNSKSFGDVQRSRQTFRGRLRLAILRRWADVIVTLDREMEKEVLDAGFDPKRVVLMDNGIDSLEFQPCSNKEEAKSALGLDRKTVAIYTGRFVPQKALPVLLRAMQSAKKSCHSLHLVLLGQGEDEPFLRELSEELCLTDSVTFVGMVDDVRSYLNAADIFVLPSLAEGISNSMLEAMSCGIACIATRVGGTPDVLGNGDCGLIVSINSVKELADALINLASNPNERARLGANARKRILDRFDIRAVGSSYLKLYQGLVEAG